MHLPLSFQMSPSVNTNKPAKKVGIDWVGDPGTRTSRCQGGGGGVVLKDRCKNGLFFFNFLRNRYPYAVPVYSTVERACRTHVVRWFHLFEDWTAGPLFNQTFFKLQAPLPPVRKFYSFRFEEIIGHFFHRSIAVCHVSFVSSMQGRPIHGCSFRIQIL